MVDKQLIFISGIGRSGTSLLQSMLNAHPEISIPPETHFFKRYIVPFLVYKKLPTKKDLEKNNFLSRLDESVRDEIINSPYECFTDVVNSFLRIMDNPYATFIGDKDTEYIRYLPHIAYVFPNSYFLHIIRDPRDVILSRIKSDWGKRNGVAYHAAEYQYYIHRLTSLGPKLFGENYIELKYEDLVIHPELTLIDVLKYLGLNFNPLMLQYDKLNNQLVGTDERRWKENVRKPLIVGNTEKWKGELSFQKVGLIENGIEDFMNVNQYITTSYKPTMFGLFWKNIVMILFKVKTFIERVS